MKITKTILWTLTALVMLVCNVLCISVAADETEYVPDLAETPNYYDPEHIAAIEELNANIALMLGADTTSDIASPQIAYPIISTQTLNVPLYMQDEEYYCGTACVQMVLSYFGTYIKQSVLATSDYLNTDNDEMTYVYKIVNVLNSFLGSGTYEYTTLNSTLFKSGLQYSINKGYPVICRTQTQRLPNYNGYSCNHYVVSTGYLIVQYSAGGTEDTETVYYNDPNNNTAYYGSYSCNISVMSEAIKDNYGYYYILAE